MQGNTHRIKKFKTLKDIEQHLLITTENQVYFDIDLDFFTINNPYSGKGNKFTYMTKQQIVNLLSVDTPFIQWIFKRLVGFTIATEPKHCGGILQSNKILDTINMIYFKPDIFTENCNWRHMK